MSERQQLRAAVVQAAPTAFDLEGSLRRVDEYVGMARGAGAELVVLPEAFVGGYPKGADFGARIGMRSPEGREWFRRYFDSAITLPGEGADRLFGIAKAHAVHLVAGVIERDGGTLYCTAVIIAPTGELIGMHRKLVPTAMERLIWGRGDGSTMPVVSTELGNIGTAICWENYMPLYRATLYAKGIQLYCAPTVDDRDQWIPSMRHIATEGRCFVLSACQFATRADYPDDYECSFSAEPDTVLIRGGSCIVDPFGEVLAGPLYGETGVLCADLDLGQIARGKYDLDVAGHYARGDVFRLSVDERDQGSGRD